jgi:hypothetical protein
MDVVDDVSLGDMGLVGLESDVGPGNFPRLVAGDGDDHHILHSRHGVDDALQLCGGHLKAFVFDELLAAVSDVKKSLLIEFGDVSGVHEPVGTDCFLRGVLVVQVALHHLRDG